MRRNFRKFRQMKYLKRMTPTALILLIALLSLVIGFLGTRAGLWILERTTLDDAEWSNLGTLASITGLAFTLGAGMIVLIQILEVSDSRNLGIYKDIYEKMMADDEIEARRHIYGLKQIPAEMNGKPTIEGKTVIQELLADSKNRSCIKKTLNLFDYFGFLVEQEWVTADEIVDWLSPVVVKVWCKIGPVVEYEREIRREEPDYYQAAVNLNERCQVWRARHYPERRKTIIFDEDRL
jgi:hypothetical protein